MDYRLATALRGPDHDSLYSAEWKSLVTAPLRWFAAMLVKRRPSVWAHGSITSPAEVLQKLSNYETATRDAAKFGRSKVGKHVVNHAQDAFEYLVDEAKLNPKNKELAKKLFEALKKHALL